MKESLSLADDVILFTLILMVPLSLHCTSHALTWCGDGLQILLKPSYLINRKPAAGILKKLLRKGTWLEKNKRISGNKKQEKEEGGLCAWHELRVWVILKWEWIVQEENCDYETRCIHQEEWS